MKINTSLTAIQNVFAQINADNPGLNLDATKVTVGAPTVFDDGVNPRNTSINVVAKAGSGWNPGSGGDLKYTRLTLDKGVVTPNLTIAVGDTDDAAAVLATAVAQLGLVASDVEWQGTPTIPADGANNTATIKAIDGSYLYVGSLVLTLDNEAAPPEDLEFQTTDLNGFDPA